MSEAVDKRIVEMQFENNKFEKGVSSTIESLEKLEEALSIKEGVTGLKNIDKAISNVDFKSMESAIDNVSNKFSALGVIGFTAIQKVTNSVLDLSARMAKGITTDPITDGLNEYTLKMDSIKTIQTNTLGKSTLEDINGALAKLNEYADKTIYNFAEMTRNIGTFTAAGIDLDKSVTGIQGIANLAAASGSNAQQASTAMYQLSQALAAGSVKLMDWNSVVNAGMGGKLFQNALIRTSEALGTGAEKYIEAEGSFRNSLQHEWITSDVLIKTLRNFTLATDSMTEAQEKQARATLKQEGYTEEQIEQIFKEANAAEQAATKVKTFQQLIDTTKESLGSGWAQSWEYILGDISEAEKFWTSVSDKINEIIGGISDARNKFLKEWHDSGGRDALIDFFGNLVGIAEDVLKPIGEAFSEVFKPLSGKDFAKSIKNMRDFIKTFRDNLNNSDIGKGFLSGVKSFFKTLFSIVKTIGDILGAAWSVISTIVGGIASIIGTVLVKAFELFSGAWKSIAPSISDFLGVIKDGFGTAWDKVSPYVDDFVRKLSSTWDLIKDVFGKSWESLKPNIEDFKNTLSGAWQVVVDAFNKAGFTAEPFMNLFAGLYDSLKKFTSRIEDEGFSFDAFSELFGNIGSNFGDLWNDLLPKFQSFASDIGAAIYNNLDGPLKDLADIALQIGKPLEDVWKVLSGAWEVIKNAFNHAGFNGEPIINFFKGLGDSFSEFIHKIGSDGFSLDAVLELFGDIGSNFGNLWNDFLPKFQTFTSDIGTAIYDNLQGPLKDLADWVLNIKNPLEDLSGNFNANTKPILDFISGIKLPFSGDSNGPSVENAANAVQNVSNGMAGIFDGMVSLETIAKAISSPAKTVEKFFTSGIKGAIKSLNTFLTDSEVTKLADKLISMGLNAGLLAGLYETVKVLDGFSTLVTAVSGIAEQMKLLVDQVKDLTKASTKLVKSQAILNIALAVAAIAASIVAISFVPPDRLWPSVAAIMGCLAILLIFVSFMSLESDKLSFDPAKLAGLGGVFASLALVIAAIGGVIYLLGHVLTPEELDRGTTVVFRIMAFFVAFYAVMGYIEQKALRASNVGNDMLKIVAALGILYIIIKLMASLSPEEAINAGQRIFVALLLIGSFIVIMDYMVGKSKGFARNMQQLGASLALMSVAFFILSQIPIDKALQGAFGLVLIFGILIGVTTILKKGNLTFLLVKASAGIILISVAIGILAAALSLLVFVAGDNAGTVVAAGFGLTLVIGALIGLAAVLSKVGPSLLAAVPGLVGVSIALVGVIAIMTILTTIDINQILDGLGKFLLVVGALALGLAALAAVGHFGGAGLWSITLFIVGLAAAIGILSLAAVGFVAAMSMFSSVFPQFCLSIKTGMEMLSNNASEIEQNVATTTKAFAGGTADGFRDAAPQIGDSIIATLKSIAERLPEAGEAFAYGALGLVVKFITGIANAVDEYGPQLVEAVGKLLTSLGSGIANFFGDQLDGIRRQFESLENSFKSEEQIMAEHTNSMWEAARILKMKVAEASTMSKEEGAASIAEFLNGIEEHYGVRVEELRSLINANQEELGGESAIKAIDAYNQKLNEAEAPELVKSDPEKEKATAETAGFNVVDAITSIIGEKVGETDLSSIMDGNGFFDSEKLKELASSKGLDVATMLNGSIGEGIDTQAILDQVSTEGLDIESSDGIKRFQELLGEAGEGGGEAMGEGIETGFTEHLAATDVSALALKEGIDTDTLNKNMTEAGKVAAGAFASGFQDNMKIDGTDKVNDALDKLKQNGRFKSVAKSNAESAVEGFEEGLKNFAAKAADAAKDASEALGNQNHHDKAVTVGEEMVNGVIVGLGNNSGPLADAAASIITNAISAMQVAGQIRSPSRKTMWIADMMGEGLIRGLKSITPLAEKESREVMSRSLSVMMAEASYLTDLIDQMDDSPVIRPVLDLTDFTAGASQMSRLMPSAVNSTIGFASKMMDTSASRNQNGATSHVYNISLNYQAGDDANKMVRDLTFALQSKSLLEG